MRFRSDDDDGEGQVDFDAEEVDFGGAGQAGTPQAYQKDVAELKRSLDLLTKNKVESLSTSDIQGMIAMGQESAVKDLDGKLAMMKSSTMESLEQINGAYAELVKLELDRAKIFREAVSNLKQAILNTKISDSQREEMFAKVESMKSELDGAAHAHTHSHHGNLCCIYTAFSVYPLKFANSQYIYCLQICTFCIFGYCIYT